MAISTHGNLFRLHSYLELESAWKCLGLTVILTAFGASLLVTGRGHSATALLFVLAMQAPLAKLMGNCL